MSEHAPHWYVEVDAQPSVSHPFGGFWKTEADNEFGLAIGAYDSTRYYISFCGPGGCFPKGEYRALTTLEDDPDYRIIDRNTIEVKAKSGFKTYRRSAGRKAHDFIE